MADNNKPSAKPKQPEGAVNLHKSMAAGASVKEAESKALTDSQSEKKPR